MPSDGSGPSLLSLLTGIVPVLTGIFGAGLGALAGYCLKTYELRAAETTARVDDAIRECDELSRLGERYWTTETPAALAHEIVGRLHRLNGFIVMCCDGSRRFRRDEFSELYISFKQALSDGEFMSDPRPEEPDRMRRIWATRTELEISLRKARRKALTSRLVFWRK